MAMVRTPALGGYHASCCGLQGAQPLPTLARPQVALHTARTGQCRKRAWGRRERERSREGNTRPDTRDAFTAPARWPQRRRSLAQNHARLRLRMAAREDAGSATVATHAAMAGGVTHQFTRVGSRCGQAHEASAALAALVNADFARCSSWSSDACVARACRASQLHIVSANVKPSLSRAQRTAYSHKNSLIGAGAGAFTTQKTLAPQLAEAGRVTAEFREKKRCASWPLTQRECGTAEHARKLDPPHSGECTLDAREARARNSVQPATCMAHAEAVTGASQLATCHLLDVLDVVSERVLTCLDLSSLARLACVSRRFASTPDVVDLRRWLPPRWMEEHGCVLMPVSGCMRPALRAAQAARQARSVYKYAPCHTFTPRATAKES